MCDSRSMTPRVTSFAFVIAAVLVTALPAFADCFPECRAGYVCSPAGECVSACNPPCSETEQCDATARTCVTRETQASSSSDSDILAEVTAVYQGATHEEDDGSVGQGGFGVSVSAELYPGWKTLFVRPRLVLIVVEDDAQPELSVDVGYRFDWITQFGRAGVRVALVPSLWIQPTSDDAVGFYIGGQAAPFARFGRFQLSLPVEVGLQTIFDQDVVYLTGGVGVGYAF